MNVFLTRFFIYIHFPPFTLYSPSPIRTHLIVSEPFKGKLVILCPFTPKYFSVNFLRARTFSYFFLNFLDDEINDVWWQHFCPSLYKCGFPSRLQWSWCYNKFLRKPCCTCMQPEKDLKSTWKQKFFLTVHVLCCLCVRVVTRLHPFKHQEATSQGV